MKTGKLYLCTILLVCILILVACGEQSKMLESPYEGVPDTVYSFMINYMEAARDGFNKLVDMDYLPEEFQWTKELSMQSAEYVIDYEIESAEKINEDLYAFVILIKTNATMEKYTRIANFVGIIGGEVYRIANTAHIPENLREGLDAEKYAPENLMYEIEGKDILEYVVVSPEDIMGEIVLG